MISTTIRAETVCTAASRLRQSMAAAVHVARRSRGALEPGMKHSMHVWHGWYKWHVRG